MDFLRYNTSLELREPTLLFAFAGWADAGESATHALRYLVRRLGATKFAEIDPEEFYDFTQVRPETKFDREGSRYVEWPANTFYATSGYAKPGDDTSGDLIIFIGTEPNLRWRTFSESMMAFLRELGVARAVHLGALMDAVPHTREVRLSGSATRPGMLDRLPALQARRSRYSGPTGINGVLMDALRRSDIPAYSLWGHAPHYLQSGPNPKVTLRLLEAVREMTSLRIDLDPLRAQNAQFDRRVAQALSDEPEVEAYVQRLEAQWDTAAEGHSSSDDENEESEDEDDANDLLDPDEAVLSIEEYLREERHGGGDSA